MPLDDLIMLDPVLVPKVWAGGRLGEMTGIQTGDQGIGEYLMVTARPEGDSIVRSGHFAGQTLSQLWREQRGLFGSIEGDSFPLLIKLLDAGDDLSVQVHPDDDYALRFESDCGKDECWYVLEPSSCGQVILGHEARSREEFSDLVGAGRWGEMLRRVPMEEGDFFHVPAGTVHSLLAGSLVYEVQQASNVTYRIHDQDRLENGSARGLHIDKAMDVVRAPCPPEACQHATVEHEGARETRFIRGRHFGVTKLEVFADFELRLESPFLVAGVVEGVGRLNGIGVLPWDHFIVPTPLESLHVEGPITLMLTSP